MGLRDKTVRPLQAKAAIRPVAAPKYRTFRADGERASRHLEQADELVNYDAVELCPAFGAYFDGGPAIDPGSVYELRDVRWANHYGEHLRRRTAELPAFFEAGGLLVLWARGPSAVRYPRAEGFLGAGLQPRRTSVFDPFVRG